MERFVNGTVCHVKFGRIPLDGEIYNYHLAVLFNIQGLKNTVFCVPLTSPKLKHFKSLTDYNSRNYAMVKYFRYHYIKQTDSVALLEQIKTISIQRLNNFYKNKNNDVVVLNNKELLLLIRKIEKYVKMILEPKKKNIKQVA